MFSVVLWVGSVLNAHVLKAGLLVGGVIERYLIMKALTTDDESAGELMAEQAIRGWRSRSERRRLWRTSAASDPLSVHSPCFLAATGEHLTRHSLLTFVFFPSIPKAVGSAQGTHGSDV